MVVQVWEIALRLIKTSRCARSELFNPFLCVSRIIIFTARHLDNFPAVRICIAREAWSELFLRVRNGLLRTSEGSAWSFALLQHSVCAKSEI